MEEETCGRGAWHGQETVPQREETCGRGAWHGQETVPQRRDCRFCRRDVREFTGWGNTQLKVQLKRLEELEYLLVHREQGSRRLVYELLYQRPVQDGTRVLAGLLEVDRLHQTRSGINDQRSGESRPEVGP
jgi:DNA primase